MVEVEKEKRYQINNDILDNILRLSIELKKKTRVLDITCGKEGFNSLEKFGYICRIRKKQNDVAMEIKKRVEDGSFIESKVKINSIKDGIDFFSLLSMEPYLVIDRIREFREYKGLKIYIDDIDLLGLFVEIEYQDIPNAKELIDEFKGKVGINSRVMPLYGDIFKERIEKDKLFKEHFECKLKELLNKK